MMTKRVAMRGRLPAVGTLPAVHAVHLPVLAGAWLLVAAGLNKIWRPAPTSRALREVVRNPRLRALAGPNVVRGLGAVEVACGAGVLASPWAGAVWMQSALYAAFAGFVIFALSTGAPLQSCGCFGAADTPPSLSHVALNAVVAALGIAAVTDTTLGSARSSLIAHRGLGAVLSLAMAFTVVLLLRRTRATSATASGR